MDRAALLSSAETFSRYHWIMLRAFHRAAVDRFGAAALPVLEQGYRAYGRQRGRDIRDAPGTVVGPRDAASLLRNWDGCDLALPDAVDGLRVVAGAQGIDVTFPAVPGAAYFAEHGDGEALEPYWRNVLAGLAEAYDPGVEVRWDAISPDPARGWTVTWTDGHSPVHDPRPVADVFADPERAVVAIRRTTGLLAAFQMAVSRELIAAFDATGEAIVRDASYRFGAERGSAIREQHVAEGRPLNLESFLGGVQERDPAAAIFVYAGEGYLSPGVWQADCSYCPLAEVWASEGAEGLRLGYLFDAPNHQGLFESYHPGAVVKWDSLKSRGDAVCRFRFSIPELMTADDPAPGEDAPPGAARPFIRPT
ncbi:MAG: hypothetical protein JWQ20_1747 [Conexibacter sp.]|nr:hypothetical protein [Conexibacter sp.]